VFVLYPLIFFCELFIDRPTLPDLNAYVRPVTCAKWHDLGLALGIIEWKLKEIKANSPNDVGECCREMFSYWLQRDVDASWKKLIAALESPGVEHNSLAESIRCKLTPGMLRICLNIIKRNIYIFVH